MLNLLIYSYMIVLNAVLLLSSERVTDDWTSFKPGSCVLPIEETGISLFSVLLGDDSLTMFEKWPLRCG